MLFSKPTLTDGKFILDEVYALYPAVSGVTDKKRNTGSGRKKTGNLFPRFPVSYLRRYRRLSCCYSLEANLYPVPETVFMYVGRQLSVSIFFRRLHISMAIFPAKCSSVPKIAPHNYATSNQTLEELIALGYTTCGICFGTHPYRLHLIFALCST